MDPNQVKAAVALGLLASEGPRPDGPDRILEAMKGIVPFEAAQLVSYDPGVDHHASVACTGYTDRMARWGADAFGGDFVFQRLYELKEPLRIDDPPHDFRRTRHFVEVVGPEGYADGLTMCLFRGTRYTGLVHLSARHPDTYRPDVKESLQALSTVLASAVDVTRLSLDSVVPPERAHAITVDGAARARPIHGYRNDSPVLERECLSDTAVRFLQSGLARLAFFWDDPAQGWHEVMLLRAEGAGVDGQDLAVLAARARPRIPANLTPRELDVLTGVATGHTNAQIAARLFLGTRTVSTHVDRILDKLTCATRTAAAARALQEGLLTHAAGPRPLIRDLLKSGAAGEQEQARRS